MTLKNSEDEIVRIHRADLAYVLRSMTELDDSLVKLQDRLLRLRALKVDDGAIVLAQSKLLTVRENLRRLHQHVNNQ